MDLLWSSRQSDGRQPDETEAAELLAEVRANARAAEQGALDWLNKKMAKPPRSGFWSNVAPYATGWIFLMILGALAIILALVALLGRTW